MAKLKPCPFCGSENAKIYNISGLKQMSCKDCCATTSLYPTDGEAVEAWNRRADDSKKVGGANDGS